jgi:outer membrane protein assembly factor BamB
MVLAGCTGGGGDEAGVLRTMADGDEFVVPRIGRSGICAQDYRSEIHLVDQAGSPVWSLDVPWVTWSDAVVAAGGLVVGASSRIDTDTPYVFALDLADGSPIWQRAVDQAWSPLRRPLVDAGVVVIGDAMTVIGLAATSGELLWRHDSTFSEPVLTEAGLAMITDVGSVIVIDPATGSSTATGLEVDPEVGAFLRGVGDLVLVVEPEWSITALDPATGERQWSQELEVDEPLSLQFFVVDDVLLAVASGYGTDADGPVVRAFDGATGAELWEQEANVHLESWGDLLRSVLVDHDDRPGLRVLDLGTGEARWSVDLGDHLGGRLPAFVPLVHEVSDMVLVSLPVRREVEGVEVGVGWPYNEGVLLAFDLDDGSLQWASTQPTHGTASVTEWGHTLLVGWAHLSDGMEVDDAAGGKLTGLRTSDGEMLWSTDVRDPLQWHMPPALLGGRALVASSDTPLMCG